jgi:hypothetical protein
MIKKISEQLKNANQELIKKTFKRWISRHRYPWIKNAITAIRAASEILHDDDDIPKKSKNSFYKALFRIGSFESFNW